MNIDLSRHALKRQQSRGIDDLMLSAARAFGEKVYCNNTLYFFMSKRAVQRMLKVYRPANPEKWEGVTLVCDPKSEKVITVFKNKRWLKKLHAN